MTAETEQREGNVMDETYRVHLVRMAEYARAEADRLKADVAAKAAWQWDLGRLARRDKEAELLQSALDNGVDMAARTATSLITSALSAGGPADPHERAVADSHASAALDVLRVLNAVGVSEERVGALLLGAARWPPPVLSADTEETPMTVEIQPPTIVVDLAEALWDTIARIRDASPRLKNDADTDELVAALWPLIGRFLRDAAREHMYAARAEVDDAHDDLTPTGRALLSVKAQALTDLADKADPGHAADTAAVFA